MPPQPRISAVIPAYNSAAFIGEALASIRAQTRPVDEIIVVDDGSTDATRNQVEACGRDIKLISQSNAGPSAARNSGVEAASGDWIAFLDADDRWLPDKNERQLALLERHPELVLIAGDMREIDEAGGTVTDSVLAHHGLLAEFEALDGAPVPDAAARLLRKNFIPTGTVLVRRELLLTEGGFDTGLRYGEDLELWVRIALHQPIAMLPEVLMLRRLHGANATRSTLPMLESLVQVAEAAKRRGAAELRRQGLDVEALIAQAWWQLGYRHFDEGRLTAAGRAFRESWSHQPSPRSLLFRLACRLPGGWVQTLRQLKRRWQGEGRS
ncbi:glycosyltransferase [Thiohalobacter sp. IOR34]|uniref:glycosyltransferase family 2 protein n=1 Tax=Thiohalobacter sp. IOR34 TaxID=3057176 RepID=UPI0025B2215A|nr:glycosyltransferase [Thiohalobacter sp. IOR34]WJW74436.1 glycosyltransferase [Thiohalobacter sp. IOR34]